MGLVALHLDDDGLSPRRDDRSGSTRQTPLTVALHDWCRGYMTTAHGVINGVHLVCSPLSTAYLAQALHTVHTDESCGEAEK